MSLAADRRTAFAEAAWRTLEETWRRTGTLAGLAAGFRPEGFEAFPRLTVADAGRLDRLAPACLAPVCGGPLVLRLPWDIRDIWVDFDELGDEVIAAIAWALSAPPGPA